MMETSYVTTQETINYRGFVIEIEHDPSNSQPWSACYLIPMPDEDYCDCVEYGDFRCDVLNRAQASIDHCLTAVSAEDDDECGLEDCEHCGAKVPLYGFGHYAYAASTNDIEDPEPRCLCQWCAETLPKHPEEGWPIIPAKAGTP